MKINVGSKNQNKVIAVEEAVRLYPIIFPSPEIIPMDVAVELFGHPKNLEQTVQGAMDRAQLSFVDCGYSFGLEGGLLEVPHTKSGYMEIGACAIYDGKKFHLGLSCAFEWPKGVTELILSKGLDGSQAVKEIGLTKHEKLGAME